MNVLSLLSMFVCGRTGSTIGNQKLHFYGHRTRTQVHKHRAWSTTGEITFFSLKAATSLTAVNSAYKRSFQRREGWEELEVRERRWKRRKRERKREREWTKENYALRGQLGEETPIRGCCTKRASLLLTETHAPHARTHMHTQKKQNLK